MLDATALIADRKGESGPTSISLPETCIGCGAVWEAEDCTRCGLARTDAATLLAQACVAFSLARTSAQAGRFADAERHLDVVRASGLMSHPVVRRLSELCDFVQGKNAGEAARSDYTAAQKAAQRGELFEAAIRAEQSTLAVPALLPAQKLRVLCLAAMGRGDEAELLRRALLRDLPAEPDLLRWQFAPTLRRSVPRRMVAPVHRKTLPVADLVPVDLQKPPRPEWIAVGGMVLGFTALAVSATTALRPAPQIVFAAPTPMPLLLSSPAATEKPRKAAIQLPADLQRAYDETRNVQTEQQARRWLNESVSAFRKREWIRAERLAAAAFEIGPRTYLAEDALLLQAKAADNQGNNRAVGLYLRLADLRPQSPYAPVALSAAMQAANRYGNKQQEERLRARLLSQYPNSAQAKRFKGMIE